MIHNGQRYYDPQLLRWTQPDPLNQPSDLLQANRYGYGGGNPINVVDPAGLKFGVGSKASCTVGPISVGASRNDKASKSSWSVNKRITKFGFGCSGRRYAHEGKSRGIVQGARACAIACAGYSSKSGFEYGFGPEVSIDLDIDIGI